MAVTRPLAITRQQPILPALLAAGAALLVNLVVPVVSALLVAMALGAVVANSPRVSSRFLDVQAQTTKLMLRVGIVALGLQLPLQQIAQIGIGGSLIVILTVATTYQGTLLVGRRLRLEDDLVALMAAGFSICGAAAIAALSDVVRPRQQAVAVAVAMVTLFGGLMIGILPWAADLLGLSGLQAAIWAGASIHEVAQVAAAASILGSGAVAAAMLVKLARVATLAPVCLLAGRRRATSSRAPLVPWFMVGFAAMVAVRSVLPLSPSLLDVTSSGATLLLAAGMFGLGLGLRARDLWPLPRAALALAAISTTIATGTSMALVLVLV